MSECRNDFYFNFRLTPETSAAAFPEFNLNDFKSSCLNSSSGRASQPNKSNEISLPSSASMPVIAAIKSPPTSNANKSYVWLTAKTRPL